MAFHHRGAIGTMLFIIIANQLMPFPKEGNEFIMIMAFILMLCLFVGDGK